MMKKMYYCCGNCGNLIIRELDLFFVFDNIFCTENCRRTVIEYFNNEVKNAIKNGKCEIIYKNKISDNDIIYCIINLSYHNKPLIL